MESLIAACDHVVWDGQVHFLVFFLFLRSANYRMLGQEIGTHKDGKPKYQRLSTMHVGRFVIPPPGHRQHAAKRQFDFSVPTLSLCMFAKVFNKAGS